MRFPMKELTVNASLKNLPVIIGFINETLSSLNCSKADSIQLSIVIDEIFGNIVFHSQLQESETVTVMLDVEEDPLCIVISFIDNGKPFDPLKTQDPDVSLPAKKRKIGGLGLFIIKNTMDSVTYERRDNKNVLTIRKLLSV